MAASGRQAQTLKMSACHIIAASRIATMAAFVS
jgi:hypothetical protein